LQLHGDDHEAAAANADEDIGGTIFIESQNEHPQEFGLAVKTILVGRRSASSIQRGLCPFAPETFIPRANRATSKASALFVMKN
jgi:hypothetical protein